MGRSLLVIILVAIIMVLMVPLALQYYETEEAFTPDNFIRINIVSR